MQCKYYDKRNWLWDHSSCPCFQSCSSCSALLLCVVHLLFCLIWLSFQPVRWCVRYECSPVVLLRVWDDTIGRWAAGLGSIWWCEITKSHVKFYRIAKKRPTGGSCEKGRSIRCRIRRSPIVGQLKAGLPAIYTLSWQKPKATGTVQADVNQAWYSGIQFNSSCCDVGRAIVQVVLWIRSSATSGLSNRRRLMWITYSGVQFKLWLHAFSLIAAK